MITQERHKRSGEYYAKVLWGMSERRTSRRIDRLDVPQDDKDLAKQLLTSHKNRYSSVAALEVPHLELSPTEKLGVVFFISSIFAVDDLIDTNKKNGSTNLFSEQLDTLKVRDTGITVAQLRDKVYDSFAGDKRTLLERYYASMLELHNQGHVAPAGTYSFKDAWEYKENTTVPFVETVADLVGFDANRRNDVSAGAMALQLVDDANDIAQDTQEESMNIYLGLATDNGELSQIDCALRDKDLTRTELFKAAPLTHAQYLNLFDVAVSHLSKPGRRGILRAIGRIYM